MKKIVSLILAILSLIFICACSPTNYSLTEDDFFLVMTNMQYYPEQYAEKEIDFNCFTYDLVDINSQTFHLGVRKCSSGYGCQCGKDTVIGFILEYEGNIPAPINQNKDTIEKSWIHIKGKIKDANKTTIKVYAYDEFGQLDKSKTEDILFLSFCVEELTLLTQQQYQNLNYYVTK